MTTNTGIRIETVKEVSDIGEIGYRITKILALTDKDLPEMYRRGEKAVVVLGVGWQNPETRLFLYDKKELVCIQGWDYVWPRFYTTEEMEKILTHIQAAGQHLTEVNAHLRKEREKWQGRVTFIDGEEQQAETASSKKLSGEQLYKITDGSWNLCSVSEEMTHIPGLKLANNKYRIISQSCDLPAHQGSSRTPKRNDTVVQDVDTGQIVFTYKRFLCPHYRS